MFTLYGNADDLARFEKTWNAGHEALALMSPATYESLRAQGLPMRLVARDTRRALMVDRHLKSNMRSEFRPRTRSRTPSGSRSTRARQPIGSPMVCG